MTSTDRTTDGTACWSPSRRTLVRTAAWSVPAVSLVAAAPAFAGSVGTSRFTVTQTRYEVPIAPEATEFRLDVLISGTVPSPATIVWTPSLQGVQGVGAQSPSLTPDFANSDFADGPAYFGLSGSSFWIRDGLNDETKPGGCTLQLLSGSTLVDSITVVYDRTMTEVPPPNYN